MATEYTRMIQKRTFNPEGMPSIPTTDDINAFTANDIFVGELFINAVNGKIWTRTADEIVLLNPTKTYIVNLGPWDMSSTLVLSLPGGIDPYQVVSMSLQVANDDNDAWYVNGPDLWVNSFDGGSAIIMAGGALTANTRADFDRGYLKIEVIR